MNFRGCLILVGTLWPLAAFAAEGDTFFTGNALYRYCVQSSESAPVMSRAWLMLWWQWAGRRRPRLFA